MKKLMFGLAIAAVGSAFAVESSNIVGYNQVFIKGNKMNLLTISWDSIGQSVGRLGDVMDKSQLTSYSEDGDTSGDYIDTWDMSIGNWGQTYYYVNQPGWNDPVEAPGMDWTDTWMDVDFIPCNPEMVSGSSFWLFHSGSDIAALNFAGQVTATPAGYTLAGGKMNLCGNPYPTNLDLRRSAGQVVISNPTSYSEDGDTAGDYIDTWDLSSGNWGQTYYYVNQPSWNDPVEAPGLDWTDTWMDVDFIPCATTIQPGAGFWYFATGNGVTFTFTDLN